MFMEGRFASLLLHVFVSSQLARELVGPFCHVLSAVTHDFWHSQQPLELPCAWPCRKMPEVKEFQGLEIDLQYLNGDDTLRHQAALFWNASLLIWPHGATMAMTTFLPRVSQQGRGRRDLCPGAPLTGSADRACGVHMFRRAAGEGERRGEGWMFTNML